MSHLICYPVSSANILYPFPLVTLCLLIFPAFLDVGSVEQGPWNVFPSRIRSWESAQWTCEAWLALSRTFGQLGGRCANSDSRCIKWGGSHFSSEGFWSTLPIFALPRCCALWYIQAASLPLILDFCLHHNITTVLSFDLQHCLKVGMLPWAGFFLPRHNFSFLVWEISVTVLLFGSNTTRSSRWLLRGPPLARVPSRGKDLGEELQLDRPAHVSP